MGIDQHERRLGIGPAQANPHKNVIARAVARAARFRFAQPLNLGGCGASSGGPRGCADPEIEVWETQWAMAEKR